MNDSNKTQNAPIHTIFGAGQVGTKLARVLAAQGIQVRLVRRSPPGPAIPGVTWIQGDVTDSAFADRAAAGAAVVYNCTNPSAYHNWDSILPPLVRGVRGAAARAGARLVILENLYMLGRPNGPMTEDSPMQPCSHKGELRAQLTRETWAAHDAGEVMVTVGRASDYFGPNTPSSVIFRERFFERLAAGKAVEVLGDPDQLHSYSYTPDVARGLAVLGTDPRAIGKTWHLPVAAQRTTRELIERFAAAAGRPARLRTIPTWLLKATGVVVPLMGALAEMVYQWETPFVVDDSRFTETFGVAATPLNEAVAATLEAAEVAIDHQETGAAVARSLG